MFQERFNIDVRINSEAIYINRENKKVEVRNLIDDSNYELEYDTLVLSPGAEPIKPPFKGMDEIPAFSLRTIPDTFKIVEHVNKNKPKRATIVGGGFIGLEMAENLHEKGIEVTIIELMDQVMITLDREMAQYVHFELYRNDIELILGDGVNSFETDDTDQTKVITNSGREVPTDLVILAIGVRPESKLAKESGLELSERGHILVNEKMQTSDPNIYAVGDAVQVTNFITKGKIAIPLAGPANKQGRIAANNIAGKTEEYEGMLGAAVVKVFDLTVSQVGLNEKALKVTDIEYEKVYLHPLNHAGYYPGADKLALKVLFEKNNGKVLGAQILGGKGAEKRTDVISTIIHFSGTVFDLEKLELTYAPPFGSAKDPVNMAGYMATNIIKKDIKIFHWHDISDIQQENGLIFDVRRDDEFELGFIESAKHFPEFEVRERLDEIPKEKKIHLYCEEGFRAYLVQKNLLHRGYDVYNLVGGYKTYKMATASQEELKEMAKNPPFRIIF
ncbi:MAG: FAD-dependent oxidoreductase [Candidatus Heimdallarchaeaceae archaeon]